MQAFRAKDRGARPHSTGARLAFERAQPRRLTISMSSSKRFADRTAAARIRCSTTTAGRRPAEGRRGGRSGNAECSTRILVAAGTRIDAMSPGALPALAAFSDLRFSC